MVLFRCEFKIIREMVLFRCEFKIIREMPCRGGVCLRFEDMTGFQLHLECNN